RVAQLGEALGGVALGGRGALRFAAPEHLGGLLHAARRGAQVTLGLLEARHLADALARLVGRLVGAGADRALLLGLLARLLAFGGRHRVGGARQQLLEVVGDLLREPARLAHRLGGLLALGVRRAPLVGAPGRLL